MTAKIMTVGPLLALGAALLPWHAQAGTVFSTADTWIRSALPTTSYGSDQLMLAAGTGTAALVLFDLTPFAGHTVTGPATLSFVFRGIGNDTQGTVSFNVHRALSSWNEATTWNTFGVNPGVTAGEDFDATVEGSYTAFRSLNQGISLTIAASVLQGWIDNPASNRGLLIDGQTGFLTTREWAAAFNNSGFSPQLTFNSEIIPPPTSGVPEPASIALVAAAAVALALKRARG
jgi:hypothetical protein